MGQLQDGQRVGPSSQGDLEQVDDSLDGSGVGKGGLLVAGDTVADDFRAHAHDVVGLVNAVGRQGQREVEQCHLQRQQGGQTDAGVLADDFSDIAVEQNEYLKVGGDSLGMLLDEGCKAVHEGREDGAQVNAVLQVGDALQHGHIQCFHVELVRERLYDGLQHGLQRVVNAQQPRQLARDVLTLHTVTLRLPRQRSNTGMKNSIVTSWGNVGKRPHT